MATGAENSATSLIAPVVSPGPESALPIFDFSTSSSSSSAELSSSSLSGKRAFGFTKSRRQLSNVQLGLFQLAELLHQLLKICDKVL